MQGDACLAELVGEGYVAAVGTDSILQPDVVVQPALRYNQFQTGLLQIVHLIPSEAVFVWVGKWGNLRFSSLQVELETGCIAQSVAQGIDTMVEALLVNGKESSLTVVCMQHPQPIARLDERFHEFALRPGVDVAVLFLRETVDNAAEHFRTIDFQHDGVYTISIAYTVHEVVSPHSDAYHSPGRNGTLRMGR